MERRWMLSDGHVDLDRGAALRGDREIRLTTKERQLLSFLAHRAGQEVHRDELLREVWGYRGRLPASRAPDCVVRRLREKIELQPAAPTMLLTVHGHGYRLVPWEGPAAAAVPVSAPRPAGTAYEAAWYAPRPREEAEAQALLAMPGAPVVLLGGQGCGKTWLMHHLLRAEPDGAATVWLDAGTLPPGTALEHVALELADVVGLPEEVVGRTWARRGDPRRHLARLLHDHALPALPGLVRVAVDNVDRLSRDGDPEGVYGLLRSLASRPGAPWDRLRLVLAISTEPALLVSDPGASPFNLAPPVRLGGFSAAAVRWLADRHGGGWSDADLAGLTEYVGGHPFFVRHALAQVAAGRPIAQVLSEPSLYERALRTRLALLKERPDLARVVHQMLDGSHGMVDPLLGHDLERAGVARVERGTVVFASPLIERYLRSSL